MKNKTWAVLYDDKLRFVRADEANEDSFCDQGKYLEVELAYSAFGNTEGIQVKIEDGVLMDGSTKQLLMCL